MASLLIDFQPYSAYKPSGVEWLGDVPHHWETPRLKGYVTNAIDLTRAPIDGELYLALEHVESWTGRFSETGDGVNPSGQVKLFHADDVLFGKLRPYLAKVICPKRNGVCVGEFLVLRPHDAHLLPRYLEQLLRSKPAIDAIDSSTFGAKMPRADWQFIGDLPFPLPPLPEQTAIVRYFDYVDRRIRRYVNTKRKLIALLEEEKQAIINRAVTRGLDPDVRLKPSGVDWLGDVPEHWEIKKVTHMFSIGSGTTPPTDHSEYYGGDIDWITTSELRESIVTSTRKTVTREALQLFPALRIYPAGSVAVAMYGATIGRVGVLGTFATVNQACCVFINSNNMNTWFWFYWLQSKRHVLVSMGYGGGQPNLSLELLRSIRVATPSLLEQTAIVEHLDKATASIDSAIARARHQIELVQEYRTRLISDVVTGKLDVREAAALLPDEEDEPNPIDDSSLFADDIDDEADDLGEPEEEWGVE